MNSRFRYELQNLARNVQAITPLLIRMLNEKDAIFDKIRKSGKDDLFAEFLYFHRFGSPKKAFCYDISFFRTHGVAILEDFMITLADGIASIYLELISVDSKFSNELNSGGLDICNLSSRSLQKLRNEVKRKKPLSLLFNSTLHFHLSWTKILFLLVDR